MVSIIKSSGEKEIFSEEKLRASIHRTGIPDSLQDEVVAHVKSKLYENIKTSEIYEHVLEFLETSNHPFAKSKYSLKKSIMDLGPTGYPFENYIAEVLKSQGYDTKLRQTLQGKCITHEVDVVAQKEEQGEIKKILVEAKFHNLPGTKTNVHVPLYTKSRFDDVKEKHNLTSAWIITNTNTTSDAIAYALCMDMKIISWSYPSGEGLRDLIEKTGLSPITALSSLPQSQKQQLLQNGVVLCKQLAENKLHLDSLGLADEKKHQIIMECQFLSTQQMQ